MMQSLLSTNSKLQVNQGIDSHSECTVHADILEEEEEDFLSFLIACMRANLFCLMFMYVHVKGQLGQQHVGSISSSQAQFFEW